MNGLPLWDVPVFALKPGDVIHTEMDDITVSTIETLGPEGPYPNGWRVRGRITRGYGKGKRELAWSYHADHVFPTILRAKLS